MQAMHAFAAQLSQQGDPHSGHTSVMVRRLAVGQQSWGASFGAFDLVFIKSPFPLRFLDLAVFLILLEKWREGCRGLLRCVSLQTQPTSARLLHSVGGGKRSGEGIALPWAAARCSTELHTLQLRTT